ncbi:sporulation killing factor system integral membrane protein [Bacillus sp. GBSC66]|uniref:sporulation killing factor system integral membrane protein n=1 Tax=Bacillus sp. GBSC66 TaxID=2108537 RepID=UPI000D02D5C5|nr:sporulation killing factor system integral membrane protein [Bacillus sp. GBSC66]PRS49364.1 sporulation killing factor system integral membrane protein [Bacillus sp. GBSC66]
MNNTLSLLWMKSQRRLISKNQEKKMPFVILLLFIAAIGFQLSAVSSMGDWNTVAAGWIIVCLFVLYTGFGLFTNRLPSQMNDIIWLYGNGASLWTVVISVWLYHIFWRGALLIVSAVAADFLLFFMTQQYPFLLGRSLILTGLLCLVETWMIAMSCARTIRVYKRLLIIGFVLMFCFFALLVLNQFMMKQPFLMNIADSLMFQAGRMIEEFSIFSFCIFIGVMFLSFMMMYKASHRLEMKELLVKKYATFHLLSTMLLIGTYYVVLTYFSDWLNLFLIVIASSVLFSSYYAGIVRHAQTGVLYLFPGALYQKIILLEVFQTFWLYAFYLISLYLIEIQDVLYWTLFGGGVYIWFLAIRLFAFMQPLRRERSFALAAYYRSLLFASVISAMVMISIHLITDGLLTTIVSLVAGAGFYVLCYRYRAVH